MSDARAPPPLVLEHVHPETRLLEKRRQMFEVQDRLEEQKAAFAKASEAFDRREETLRRKDLDLQESLVRFSKFLQENDGKRTRAQRKAQDEIKIRAGAETPNIFTTRSVLTSVPGSKLAKLFSGDLTLKKDKNGAVFLDRDGDMVKWMVNYLRQGRRELPRGVDSEDARYFIEELKDWGVLREDHQRAANLL